MEKKEVNLRFVQYKKTFLYIGMFVRFRNRVSHGINKFGYLEEIRNDPSGFNYGIRELYDNELYFHHIDSIQPIKPILTIANDIQLNEHFYNIKTSEIHYAIKRIKSGKKSMIETYEGFFPESQCERIMATTDQIGWKYYKGPPHDHAYDYRKGAMVEMYTPKMIHDIIRNKCRVEIDIITICPNYNGKHIGRDCSCKSGFITAPYLFQDKVVMHIKNKKKNAKRKIRG